MRLSIFPIVFCIGVATAQCNGYTELCDRLWSNVSQIGSHDSAFVGNLPTDNQNVSVADQLDAGIRFLQGQTHYFLGELSMCHTSCYELYAGTLVSYLTTIKTWMDANSNEVITLLLTNGDSENVSLFGDAFVSSGLSTYAYTPSGILTIPEWPTLQELINADTRLIMFLDYGADTATVPYINDEFTYFFETPYDTTDPTFPECTIDRPPGASATGRMYIVNHFLDVDVLGVDVPDTAADSTTNAATGTGSIGAQADLCISLYGINPNFVLVDEFNTGNVFAAQNTLNGVS